jgi:hypothetical protein
MVTHDLELAAIMHTLNMWRHYLLGRSFVLMINYYGIKYVLDHPTLNARYAKWMALINEFDFEIKHIKWKYNGVVDELNRSVRTIHLAISRVEESDINHRIETLLQEDECL